MASSKTHTDFDIVWNYLFMRIKFLTFKNSALWTSTDIGDRTVVEADASSFSRGTSFFKRNNIVVTIVVFHRSCTLLSRQYMQTITTT